MLELLKDAIHFLSDIRGLIQWGGVFLVCAIIFIETGLFVGFFLPGDSLLVTAGVFAATGQISLGWLLLLASICAIAGDQLGYWIGKSAGQALYKREDSFLFKKRHLQRAHEFYEKYGAKTIVIARFVPIVRTFAPPVAGAANMNYRRFISFNVIGGLLWVWSMLLGGYFLGSAVPNVENNMHIVIAGVIFLSLLPAVFEAIRHRNQKMRAAAEISISTKNVTGNK
jgi:membrane-associated protein